MMSVDYKSTIEAPRQIFARRLLNMSIRLSDKTKGWNCSHSAEFTHDKKYCIAHLYKNETHYIDIYNPKTQAVISQIPHYQYFTLFKTKNILLLHGEKNKPALLYDIEDQKQYPLWDKKLFTICLSKDENYVAGFDGEQILLFNISDIINISFVSSEYEAVSTLAISSDNKLLAVSFYDDRSIKLWENQDGILKNIVTYNEKDVAGRQLQFFDNDQCLMASFATRHQQYCCNLKITREAQSITMKEEFYWQNTVPYWCWKECTKTKISDNILIMSDSDNHTLTITTIHGKELFSTKDISPWRVALSEDEQLIVASHSGIKITTLLRLSYNDQNDEIKVHRKDIYNNDNGSATTINCFSNLILLSGFNETGSHYKVFLYDIDGNLIKDWYGQHFSFHPNGRSVFIDNKKHTLFPHELHEHYKKISFNPTLPQYYILHKFCKS